MVLAVGELDFLSDGNLNEADGPALRAAGRRLADFPEYRERFDFVFADSHADAAPNRTCARLFGEFVDFLVTEWTTRQARACGEMLRGRLRGDVPSQREIAERWEPEAVARQTVHEHLKRGEWDRLRRLLSWYHELLVPLQNST